MRLAQSPKPTPPMMDPHAPPNNWHPLVGLLEPAIPPSKNLHSFTPIRTHSHRMRVPTTSPLANVPSMASLTSVESRKSLASAASRKRYKSKSVNSQGKSGR